MVEVELTPPVKEPYMDFESNCKVREEYVKFMIEALKNKYQRAIENYKWEIFLVPESKASELIKDMEPVLEGINLN